LKEVNKVTGKRGVILNPASIFNIILISLDYLTLLSYFESHNVDVALCDHFMGPCADAATTFKIPYIVTGSIDFSTGKYYLKCDLRPSADYETLFYRVCRTLYQPRDTCYG
jgi:hypothetical protein